MARPLRIVAADDEPDLAQFYESALAKLGHEVYLAKDGVQLVELCRAVRPQLVLTDVRMPGMTGPEAVRLVWRERAIPVVLVSTTDPEPVPGGVSVCLRKPFGVAELWHAVGLAVQTFAAGTARPRP
jgi:response regulator NasT